MFKRVVLTAFAEPLSASSGCGGLGEAVGKSPLASVWSERFVRGPLTLGMTLTLPFAQKEGWNVSGYPRWARVWTLPVSCYRVVRVEARTPFARGRLAVRDALQEYQRVSLVGAEAVR